MYGSTPIITSMRPLLFTLFALSTSAIHATDITAIQRAAQQWLDQSLANSNGVPSYQLSQIDKRIQLAPCKQYDVGLPSGYRLLGNTMLRIQCVDGASWGINLPVKVSLLVTYYTAARPLSGNQEIGTGDLSAQQGDLGTLPGSVIMDPSQAVGRVLNTAVASGKPLRSEMLRAAMVIQQNQKVRVIYRDDVIEVANEGIAMNNAAEGQSVRVRVGTRQIIQGIATATGSVDVSH
ncbi:flagella basal body P-ring formation protein FlgA [Iodobacter fluviatilis]|uniref:Flagella basal body P-ring formation protein FlgA n=2 Tax=Iodobacter fluviatilis TaxID=537 RepID=A0A377Q6R5_9NEIS|nr:flagella basal body P-ring formation protein FlgA [Iodobacter fluviatilis]STQ90964.1 flagellar basal body P-ring biosynthesis protein FlgA [Iodobacter fluviatilis]